MANWDNHATKQTQEDMQELYDKGIDDARNFQGYPLPSFFSKPVIQLKPYERGFVFGVWLRDWLKNTEVIDPTIAID